MQTGQIIQQLRQNADMTQNELAERLFVSRDLVSKWESGARRPDYTTVKSVADIFGVSPDDIMKRDELLLSELGECIPEGCSADREILDRELNAFLHTLKERECDVFIRRYHFLDENSDIASFYGMREENVRLILHRTRKKLKAYLTEVLK